MNHLIAVLDEFSKSFLPYLFGLGFCGLLFGEFLTEGRSRRTHRPVDTGPDTAVDDHTSGGDSS